MPMHSARVRKDGGRELLADGELVAQCEDFGLEGGSRSEAGAERREEGEDDCLHGRSRLADSGNYERVVEAEPCAAQLP